MATANIRAVITADDRASPVLKKFGDGIDKSSGRVRGLTQSLKNNTVAIAAVAAGSTVAFSKLTGVLGDTINAANRYQAAFTGLRSIARAFNQDADKATDAARSLAQDGLMSVTDAATGLKNLLASGFSLDQSITLMKRFKDSAAFGKQAALTFGQAIAGATEGIKNGNSILVDNAGVTKNLSVILTEAGFSAQDLMRASTDASVRQALFNGILKETAPMLGDAARLSDLYAGKQAKLSTQIEILKARIGESLQPVLANLLTKMEPLIAQITRWIEKNPKVVATVLLITTAAVGLTAVLATLGIAIIGVTAALGAIASPVVLVTAGIVAMSASVVVLIKQWDKLSIAVRLAMIGILGPVGIAVGVIRSMQNTFVRAFNAIRGAASGAFNFIRNINWGSAITGIGTSIGNAIIGKIESGLRAALSVLPGNIESRVNLPRFAQGVQDFSGGMAIVGERGPEVVNLPRGSDVIPNHQLGGVGANINLSVNVGVYAGTEIEKRKLAQELYKSLTDLASMRGQSVSQLLGG